MAPLQLMTTTVFETTATTSAPDRISSMTVVAIILAFIFVTAIIAVVVYSCRSFIFRSTITIGSVQNSSVELSLVPKMTQTLIIDPQSAFNAVKAAVDPSSSNEVTEPEIETAKKLPVKVISNKRKGVKRLKKPKKNLGMNVRRQSKKRIYKSASLIKTRKCKRQLKRWKSVTTDYDDDGKKISTRWTTKRLYLNKNGRLVKKVITTSVTNDAN